MRKGTVIIWLGFLFSGIAALFWHNDWVYNLPTPVPENYKAINAGENISMTLGLRSDNKKPRFLHFFNPGCPCSRFNMTHFKSLVKQYGDDVDFEIVVMSNKEYTEKEIQDKFGLQIPVSSDTAIAASCGVYSTPQAVIIDTDHKLYYRGNYNRSRYCSDKKTEYARMALDVLLHNSPAVAFDQFALKAYGCQLPKCTK
jgi:hypothetical protein